MEIGSIVQCLLNALNVFITPRTSTPSSSATTQSSNGVLSVAPTASTPLTSSLKKTIKRVNVLWTSQSRDGLFGEITIKTENGDLAYNEKGCTNLADRIEDGEYKAVVDLSPRLQYMCPHIRVPVRDAAAGGDAGLRIHKANTPSQSLGCIFPGEKLDGDAVDDSKDAFDALMALLPQDGTEFDISISTNI